MKILAALLLAAGLLWPAIYGDPPEATVTTTTVEDPAPGPTTPPITLGVPIRCDPDGVIYEWGPDGWEGATPTTTTAEFTPGQPEG